ncbi:MAG TPA: sulfotransferase [Gemmatimonadota bacterium]|nr:sulfotransferase [Gemmatimonadota bacterium]
MKNGSHDRDITRLLLIGGRPRSGTTLLRDLCDAHPYMTLTHEFGTFAALNEPYHVYRRRILGRWRAQPILKCRTFRPLSTMSRPRRWAISTRGHAFAIRYLGKIRRYRSGPIDLSAIDATLREVFPRAGILGDKTPEYVHLLDKLAPTSGLSSVMIYRDCRDVTSSHLKMARTSWRNHRWIRDQDTAEKVARLWVDALETMERHRDRIHIIRYEDLVREPRRELTRLAEWLGVDPAGFPEASIRSVRDNGIGKHRNGLSEQEMEAVMNIAGPTMARLGYV